MGCVVTTNKVAASATKPPEEIAAEEAKKASLDVDAELLQQRIQELFCFKILLLGAGESGKSTILKQLKTIHHARPTGAELKQYTDSLHQNCIDCMRALIMASQNFGLELDDEGKQIVEQVNQHIDSTRASPELAQAIKTLFSKPQIQQAYERRNEFWILDAVGYYMEHIERFATAGYEPTEEDIVMARVRTTGIIETSLEEKRAEHPPGEPGTLRFQVVDVGGQRNERKKWIHCFDNVKAILFVDNLAGYNRVMFEDNSKNMMKDSLELFKEVSYNPLFRDIPIFLFLNKKDLFEKMIRKTSVRATFPDYTGPDDVIPSLEFISSLFRAQAPADKHIEIHYVTGLWKRDVKCAFEEVKKALLEQNAKLIEAEKKKIASEQKKINKQSGKKSSSGLKACFG